MNLGNFLPHVQKIMTTKQSQEIRFATSADGTRIAYACAGAGPVLVRAGRWIGHLELDWNSAVRRPFLDEMCRSYSYCMHDTRGTGLSDRLVTDVSLDAQLSDLAAVADSASLDQFSLLGISSASALAIAYAARHP
jgi:pimeloyl-ACP methyl ester carboxylesterase